MRLGRYPDQAHESWEIDIFIERELVPALDAIDAFAALFVGKKPFIALPSWWDPLRARSLQQLCMYVHATLVVRREADGYGTQQHASSD